MKMLKKLLKEDQGQAMVLIALVFSLLLGFAALAIDYGYLSIQKRELQNAADAAALAGVYELSLNEDNDITESVKVNIKNTVYDYARYNSNALKDKHITSTDISVDISGKTLKVNLKNDFELFFAKAIGINSSTVSANATAVWSKEKISESSIKEVNLAKRILPVAIMKDVDERAKIDSGYLGFIAYKDHFHSSHAQYYGFYGYYESAPVGLKFDFIGLDKNIESLFLGLNPLAPESLNNYKYLASVTKQYRTEVESAIIKKNIKINFLDSELDKRIEMSALIPIVETEKSIGSRLVRRDSNGYYVTAPLPYGEHYQLNVVGYREVFIKDIVKSIENGQELVKGISDNNYNFELFEDYLDSTKINNISRDYLNSIIVEFGRKFGLDEEMIISVGGESVFKKVYRLVE